MVKAGWRVSRKDPADRASMWPYLPPRFPLPSHLYFEEMDIRPCPGRGEEVPGAPEVGRSPGAEDAAPPRSSDALEAELE